MDIMVLALILGKHLLWIWSVSLVQSYLTGIIFFSMVLLSIIMLGSSAFVLSSHMKISPYYIRILPPLLIYHCSYSFFLLDLSYLQVTYH